MKQWLKLVETGVFSNLDLSLTFLQLPKWTGYKFSELKSMLEEPWVYLYGTQLQHNCSCPDSKAYGWRCRRKDDLMG